MYYWMYYWLYLLMKDVLLNVLVTVSFDEGWISGFIILPKDGLATRYNLTGGELLGSII